MKKLQLIALLLTAVMILGVLASCAPTVEDETGSTSESAAESTSEGKSEHESTSESAAESTSEGKSEHESTSETETETGTEEIPDELFQGPSADLVNLSNRLANGINVNFTNASRTDFLVKNKNMSFTYHTTTNNPTLVTSLKNSEGKAYFTNSMDMFVTMKSGSRYFASASTKRVETNFFRFGYYYYDVRFESQNFLGDFKMSDSLDIEISKSAFSGNQTKTKLGDNGNLIATISQTSDPYIAFDFIEKAKYSTEDYDYVMITMKSEKDLSNVGANRSFSIYLAAGSKNGYNNDQRIDFSVFPDGEFHTYYIPLFKVDDYTGTLKKMRMDLSGKVMDAYEISEVKLIKSSSQDVPSNLSIARTFHVYSNKLHHSVQFAADQVEVTDIKNVGMLTKIPADTVAKVVVHDKNGNHDSFDKVDWKSVEYLAFDVIGVGVFGYILPADNSGGMLEVTLENGNYVITQTATPEDGTISPSGYWDSDEGKYISYESSKRNANDFVLGQRIYTDDTHTFDKFLVEAELERNPLTGKDIKVRGADSTENAAFLGYDAIRGIYILNIDGDNFNNPQYQYPNKHYSINFDIASKTSDREIYIMTYFTGGCLESAALLDNKQMLLPVPIEVCKNFDEGASGESDLYNMDDAPFSEALLPLTLKAGQRYEYTILNLYQNWGNFPLKQISSIGYHCPYYHLSTGTTETNCIVPWYNTQVGRGLGTLPDHRGMSAPFWVSQPQHNSCGSHSWLQYTDSTGVYSASECTGSYIDSYGPVYADTVMNYYSDDGKIKLSYVHMEMPQTDENRGYYEMKYEVLEDVSFEDFSKDFRFYTVSDGVTYGYYTKIGYLDENNKCKYTDSVAVLDGVDEQKIILGTEAPYFSFFDMDEYSNSHGSNFDGSMGGYSNVSFLIKDYDINLSEAKDPRFAIVDSDFSLRLTLDLGKITLKKGDTITINAILVPWGSQEMEEYGNRKYAHAYTDVIDEATGELYMDKNVRDVRENSCVDYFKATSETDEIIDSPFLARIKSKDGKTAQFTLSGGENNMAVRVYGFDMLTVPKIEELVEGKWVEYEVSSINNRDLFENGHQYDGYNVYYDEDGTLSYAFIVDMTGDVERTFRVSADKEFEGWPKVTIEEKVDPLTLYFDAAEILPRTTKDLRTFNTRELMVESDRLFLRLGSKEGRAESYFYLQEIKNEDETIPVAGRYIVMRYRLPETNTKTIKTLQYYIGDLGYNINSAYIENSGLVNDGNWHVMIIDIVSFGKDNMVANSNGEYTPAYIRWDVFNASLPNDVMFDVEYIGLDNDLNKIIEFNSDLDTVTLYTGGDNKGYTVYDTKTKEVISNENPADSVVVKPSESTDAIKHTVSFAELKSMISYEKYSFQNVQIIDDKYVTAYAIGGRSESWAKIYQDSNRVTGQYMIFKYRMPTTNSENCKSICVYTQTTVDFANYNFSFPVATDNEWHTVIVDMSCGGTAKNFAVNSDGKYVMTYFRLDLFDYATTDNERIDIATLAFTDDLSAAIASDKTIETVSVYDLVTKSTALYNTSDGSKVE